jgi:hypothetical protein
MQPTPGDGRMMIEEIEIAGIGLALTLIWALVAF